MSATQVPAYSQVPPYLQSYATEIDVGRKFGSDSLFTASTTPNITQVRDILSRKDSWIDQALGHDFRQHSTVEVYDAVGAGRRGGRIYLRNMPVISVERVEYRQQGGDVSGKDAWIPGVQGSSAEAAGVLVGPRSQTQADYYYVYPERGEIWWGRLRYSVAQKYRVTYTYGYPSPPDWVRDLSATMAAIECLSIFSGKFMPPEPLANYELRFERDVNLLLTTAGRKPLVGVA